MLRRRQESERRFTYRIWAECQAHQKERARMVVRLLQLRFRTRPSNLVVDVIGNTNDMALLDRWFDLAFESATLAEFEEQRELWGRSAMTAELKKIVEREEALPPMELWPPETTEEMALRKQRRRMIFLVLGLRFETIPGMQVANRIHISEDLEQLDRWLELAYTANSMDNFQERMMCC